MLEVDQITCRLLNVFAPCTSGGYRSSYDDSVLLVTFRCLGPGEHSGG